jgi:hypothetical protein
MRSCLTVSKTHNKHKGTIIYYLVKNITSQYIKSKFHTAYNTTTI